MQLPFRPATYPNHLPPPPQAKSTHRLPAPALVSLVGSLAILACTPHTALMSAVTRDLRAQLPALTPPLFRELSRHLAALRLAPDTDLVEAYLEGQLEALQGGGGGEEGAGPQQQQQQQQLACVDLVCALGLMQGSVKPKASLLGPLLAATQRVSQSVIGYEL